MSILINESSTLLYTKEFQDNAVRLVVADGKSFITAARELRIPATMLRVWGTKWRKESRVKTGNSQESYAMMRREGLRAKQSKKFKATTN